MYTSVLDSPIIEKNSVKQVIPLEANQLSMRLVHLPEPERSSRWLRCSFEESRDDEITQIAIWQAYQNRFAQYNPLPPANFIKAISSTFKTAQAQVLKYNGPPPRFIIKGIRARRLLVGPVETIKHISTSVTATSCQAQPFRLLDLPAEIRQAIYRHLLVVPTGRIAIQPIVAYSVDRKAQKIQACVQLLQVSDQIYQDAITPLYSQNEFAILRDTCMWSMLATIGDTNLAMIRKLYIHKDVIQKVIHRRFNNPRAFLENTRLNSYARILAKMTGLTQITLRVPSLTEVIVPRLCLFPIIRHVTSSRGSHCNTRARIQDFKGTVGCCETHQEQVKDIENLCQQTAIALMGESGKEYDVEVYGKIDGQMKPLEFKIFRQ